MTGLSSEGTTSAAQKPSLLRYGMSELQETGGGAEMWAVEAVERNWSVSLHRVKTWRLGTGCLYL